jgi:hypothetical protein
MLTWRCPRFWISALVCLAAASASAQPSLFEESGAEPARFPPVVEANRLIAMGQHQRAIELCRANLHPHASDAKLRAFLVRAYLERDRICLPLPPTTSKFRQQAESSVPRCELSLVPRATRDTAEAVIRQEEMIAPDKLDSHLPAIDYQLKDGTPAGLRRELERLERFDESRLQAHLIGQLPTARRASLIAVATDRILGTATDTLRCPDYQPLIYALVIAGNMEGVMEAIDRIPADGDCDRQLLPIITTALTVGGRYRELHSLTRALPIEIGAIDYYRYTLTAALAAAHFDTAVARQRLDHERVNEEAYPEPAREMLWKVRELIADPETSGEDWAGAAEEGLMTDPRFRDIRHLALTLALRRSPRLRQVVQSLADDLNSRRFQLLTANLYERVAGGRNPGLDQRWDPRRPEFLSLAAASYLAGEDDASCRAVIAAIDHPAVDDRFIDGIAALRMGDLTGAISALELVREQARAPAMAEAAERLLALAADVTG